MFDEVFLAIWEEPLMIKLMSPLLLLTLIVAVSSGQTTLPTPKQTETTPVIVPAKSVEKAAPERPKGIAAKVNSQELPLVAVERALLGIEKARREEARLEISNFLIDNMLIDQALAHWKVESDPKDVQKQLEDFKKTVLDAKQDYTKVLANLMLTEEELKEQIVGQLRWEKFVATQGPEDKLKAFFDQNTDMFDGTMVRARHILLMPKNDPKLKEEAVKELQVLKAKIEADAEKAVAAEVAKLTSKLDALALEQLKSKKMDEIFSTAAREKSQCPSNRDGGDLNWFPRVGSMVEPFAKAAFALKTFQVSDVIATEFGYHLVLVTARKPGEMTKFETVKDAVREVYGMKLREKVVETMRKQAKIEMTSK